MTNEELMEMGVALLEVAEEVFHTCRADEDFCVQSIGLSNVVFGGTNRLVFSHKGFFINESHCTPQFVRLFNKYYG